MQYLQMSNPLNKYFTSVSPKQWKQKIQYLLKGENYQNLITTDIDGISTLPFYTDLDTRSKNDSSIASNTISNSAYYCIVQNAKESNNEALKAQENNITCIYFAVFDPSINIDILLKNLSTKIIIQCYFLDLNFSKHPAFSNTNCEVLFDCLGKISKTGNWYISAKDDFNLLNQCISKNHSISINLSNFHNAGASAVQQLSYGLSQLITYAKKNSINQQHTITYLISVTNCIPLEVAKIKTLRILHKQIASTLNLNKKCVIIQQKSKRNLSGLINEINSINETTERHIAQQAGVNYFTSTPRNFYFYKEDLPQKKQIFDDLNLSNQNFIDYSNDVIYIKKIIEQLLEKSIKLVDTLEQGGGYIEQLKKGTLQQKISKNEIKETKNLSEQSNTSIYKNYTFGEKTPLTYPFLKLKKRKTLWQPIIEKQWRASIELPLWKEKFDTKNG